jgi:diguanylate cyclase (GGDEF)-like protein/PAS domain S-box-containing protein
METIRYFLTRMRASPIWTIAGWTLILFIYFFLKTGFFRLGLIDLFVIWIVGILGIIGLTKKNPSLDLSQGFSEDISNTTNLLYHAIIETSPDSVSVTDLTGRFLFCSKQTAILHKFDSPEELIGKSVFKLFPLREVLRASKFLRETQDEGMIKNIEFEMVKKDGTTFPAEFSASLIRDKLGHPFAFLAIVRDVTERKWVEAQVRESEALYRVVADNTYDWEFWQAPNQRFIYISPSCKRITGYDDIEFIKDPKFLMMIIHPDDRADFAEHQHDANLMRGSNNIEFRILRGDDNGIRWISHICQPVFDRNGKFLGTRGSNRDITEKKLVDEKLQAAYDQVRSQLDEIEKLQTVLQEQAIRDSLTGLYNRRYLEEALKQEHSRAIREGQNISIVMVDMDHLKVINDSYGHLVGDKALQKLSEHLKRVTRTEDIACRYGGDEFLVILHNMTAKDAVKKAEEWRTIMEENKMPYQEDMLTVTLSAGIASFPAKEKSIDEIILAADTALYKAKMRGRNNVALFQEVD